MKSSSSFRFAAMKASIVEQLLQGETSVTDASRTLKVSRKTIYQWIGKYKENGVEGLLPQKTGPKQGSAWNRSSTETESVVLQMLDKHRDWNIYDIAVNLPEQHRVHPSTVYRIWKRHQADRPTQRLPRPKPQLYVKEEIGEEIQMDTSFPWGRATKRMCFDCLDDRSRFAFAKLYTECDQDSAISFLHYIIAHAPFIIKTIRTDNGREFSTRFTAACRQAGINHIKNEPYHPEHNGKIEKFHDGLKHRCFYVYLHPADCLAQQNCDLAQWLIWYNYHKIHHGLGMNRKTPAEVVFQSLFSESSCVRSMLQPNKICFICKNIVFYQ